MVLKFRESKKNCSGVTSLGNTLYDQHPKERLGTLHFVECAGDLSVVVLSDGIPRHLLGRAVQNQLASSCPITWAQE